MNNNTGDSDFKAFGGDHRPGHIIVVEKLPTVSNKTRKHELRQVPALPTVYAGRPDGAPQAWEDIVWQVLNLTGEDIYYEFKFTWRKDDGTTLPAAPMPLSLRGLPTLHDLHEPNTWRTIEGSLVPGVIRMHMSEQLTMRGYHRARYRYSISILDGSATPRGEIDPELVVEGRP